MEIFCRGLNNLEVLIGYFALGAFEQVGFMRLVMSYFFRYWMFLSHFPVSMKYVISLLCIISLFVLEQNSVCFKYKMNRKKIKIHIKFLYQNTQGK